MRLQHLDVLLGHTLQVDRIQLANGSRPHRFGDQFHIHASWTKNHGNISTGMVFGLTLVGIAFHCEFICVLYRSHDRLKLRGCLSDLIRHTNGNLVDGTHYSTT
jgi:hypothetical protein